MGRVVVFGRFERHERDPKARDEHARAAGALCFGQRVHSAYITRVDSEQLDPWIPAEAVESEQEVGASACSTGLSAMKWMEVSG